MIELSAFLACVILAALGVFQLLLLFGAPLGKYTQGGSYTVLPTSRRIICAISIVLYFLFALILLSEAKMIGGLDAISDTGIWVLAVFFSIGIFMNGVSRSKPERIVMTPVALVLALICLFLAVN